MRDAVALRILELVSGFICLSLKRKVQSLSYMQIAPLAASV